jgi:hypothetical protein
MSALINNSSRVAITFIVCSTIVLIAFLSMCTVVVLVNGDLDGVVQVGDVLVRMLNVFHSMLTG